MTLGIVTGFSGKHAAGLEEFLFGLLKGLEQEQSKDVTYRVYTSKKAHFEEALSNQGITGFNVTALGFGAWWKQIGLFFAPRSDAYLFNGPLVPLLFAPRHSFVLVYDFAYAHSSPKTWKARMAVLLMDWLSGVGFRRAEKIICISEATKNDLLSRFKVSPDKCVVVYPGTKDFSQVTEEALPVPERGYLFFVGTAKERKNLLNLVRGFLLAIKRGVACDLVIGGRFDASSLYGQTITQEIARASAETRVRVLGRISDGQLLYLYKHAIAFVFPSRLEGFGMPVVEAMSLGVPVLTSTASSLPEAAGDAALLVDPEHVDHIANALERLTKDDTLRATLVEKGFAHAKTFSWNKTAKELLVVLLHNLNGRD